jgi:hypothetical protein
VQFFSEPSLYEAAFNVSQVGIQEPAISLPRGSTVNDLMCATLAPTDAASSLRACR